MPTLVADATAARWISAHGDLARRWVDAAPSLAERWSHRWGLILDDPLPGGSVSVVLAARRDGYPVVLKLAVPWSTWSSAEAAALRIWDGQGAPRLLEAADDSAALLTEKIEPGKRAEALTPPLIAEILRTLSSVASKCPPEIPDLSEAVLTRFRRAEENRHGLMNDARLERAKAAALSLASEFGAEGKLLHGDFLTKNLLVSEAEGIVAIDPNPAFGDPCYDVAQWSITERPITDAHRRCCELAGLLRLDQTRVWAWAMVLAAVEISLASEERARQTLALLADDSPGWW